MLFRIYFGQQNFVIHTILSRTHTHNIIVHSHSRATIILYSIVLTFLQFIFSACHGISCRFYFTIAGAKTKFFMRCTQKHTDTFKRKSFVPFEVYHSILVKLSSDDWLASWLAGQLPLSLHSAFRFSSSIRCFSLYYLLHFLYVRQLKILHIHTHFEWEKINIIHMKVRFYPAIHGKTEQYVCVDVYVSVNDVFKVFALNAIKS